MELVITTIFLQSFRNHGDVNSNLQLDKNVKMIDMIFNVIFVKLKLIKYVLNFITNIVLWFNKNVFKSGILLFLVKLFWFQVSIANNINNEVNVCKNLFFVNFVPVKSDIVDENELFSNTNFSIDEKIAILKVIADVERIMGTDLSNQVKIFMVTADDIEKSSLNGDYNIVISNYGNFSKLTDDSYKPIGIITAHEFAHYFFHKIIEKQYNKHPIIRNLRSTVKNEVKTFNSSMLNVKDQHSIVFNNLMSGLITEEEANKIITNIINPRLQSIVQMLHYSQIQKDTLKNYNNFPVNLVRGMSELFADLIAILHAGDQDTINIVFEDEFNRLLENNKVSNIETPENLSQLENMDEENTAYYSYNNEDNDNVSDNDVINYYEKDLLIQARSFKAKVDLEDWRYPMNLSNPYLAYLPVRSYIGENLLKRRDIFSDREIAKIVLDAIFKQIIVMAQRADFGFYLPLIESNRFLIDSIKDDIDQRLM